MLGGRWFLSRATSLRHRGHRICHQGRAIPTTQRFRHPSWAELPLLYRHRKTRHSSVRVNDTSLYSRHCTFTAILNSTPHRCLGIHTRQPQSIHSEIAPFLCFLFVLFSVFQNFSFSTLEIFCFQISPLRKSTLRFHSLRSFALFFPACLCACWVRGAKTRERQKGALRIVFNLPMRARFK